MAKPGRLAILTSHQVLHDYLINQLAEHFGICLVIYERESAAKSVRQVMRRARRLGWGTVIGQLAYLLWDRLYVRPRSRPEIARLLASFNTALPGSELRQVEVNSVNDDIVVHALDEASPDICVVSGTSLIQARVLARAPLFLNIHAGITPRYRGAHGAFWAIYEGRPELAGVTIHVVDSGVDTGAIVAQAPIAIDPGVDTPRTLVAKQYLVAVPLMVEAVRKALTGTLSTTRRDDLESRLWYSPTPQSYRQFRAQLSRLRHSRDLAASAGR